MNINNVLAMKSYYEDQITTKLTEVLRLNAENVSVNWSLEQTNITIVIKNNNNTTTYKFTIANNNCTLAMSNFDTVTNNNIIVGTVVNEATIDLQTFTILYNMICDILSQDYVECDAPSESVEESEVEAHD